jgi:hypothetical protein
LWRWRSWGVKYGSNWSLDKLQNFDCQVEIEKQLETN